MQTHLVGSARSVVATAHVRARTADHTVVALASPGVGLNEEVASNDIVIWNSYYQVQGEQA